MASTSPRQRRITGRVMHEFKHGELKSGRGGKGGKVKNRRQALAIALEEAGSSKYESERRNKRNLHRTERKEAQAVLRSRNAKVSRMSARAASAKAPAPWVDATPAKRPREAARPPQPVPARATVTPGRSSMPRQRRATLRAAQK